MTARLETKRAPGVPDEEGAFSARVYVVEGPPDGDGDVILRGAIEDGVRVVVSAGGHDVIREGAEPAGEARLYHGGNAVVAIGRAFDTERGRRLRAKLREPEVEWSVGDFKVLDARPPTREERERHPATRRVITRWLIPEVSPVRVGSCGPACATLISKDAECAGPCCAVGDATRDAALRELARFERLRAKLMFSDLQRRREEIDGDRAALEAAELPADDVPRELREAAWEAVELASKILRVSAPRVRWYSYEAALETGAAGMHWKGSGEIWLASGRDAEATFKSSAHEVAHHAGLDEPRAQRFADGLSLLRGVDIRVGRRRDFEGRREPVHAGTILAGHMGYHRRGVLAPGELVVDVDDRALYEMQEDFSWRRLATLVA